MVELFLVLAFASPFAFLFIVLSWLISDEPWDELPWKDEPVDHDIG